MFIDEGLAHFLFSRIRRVDLGNFGDKGVFEFNSVIKGSMRGKKIISFFREDYYVWPG